MLVYYSHLKREVVWAFLLLPMRGVVGNCGASSFIFSCGLFCYTHGLGLGDSWIGRYRGSVIVEGTEKSIPGRWNSGSEVEIGDDRLGWVV